ncbi:MAG: GNAT family N-acetyltransferase [Clostridiaceae bacterium]|nr:GNAT family N-acetyltransferase [Clostridiaceae bacterium]
MNKNIYDDIKQKAADLAYSSLNYTEYEDVSNYEVIVWENDLILLGGFNKEAKCYEYHWAATTATALSNHLNRTDSFFLTFIPREWVHDLESIGLRVRNAWHDYFMDSLDSVDEHLCPDANFLAPSECAQASEITLLCKGQSRGFTGQTTEWFHDWLEGPSDIKNRAVLVSRTAKNEITGLVCTGTYAHESTKGPIAWIREAAVLPSWQNQGIARRLIMKALAYQKRNGAKRAFLAVDEENQYAIHLYTSIGFHPSEESSQIDMIKIFVP